MDSMIASVGLAIGQSQASQVESSISIAVMKKAMELQGQVVTQLIQGVVAGGGGAQMASPPHLVDVLA